MSRTVTGVRALLPAFFLLTVAAGCGDDGTRPEAGGEQTLGVVLNSVDVSLTLFDLAGAGGDSPEVTTALGLAPAGTPVSVAVRGSLAAVPLGVVSAVALVDLAAGEVSATYALPEGSGASGVAFVNDTLLVVTNPGRNSLSPVNLRTGTVGEEIAVGGYPQEVRVGEGRVVVINAELGPDFAPRGPGTLTLLDAHTLEPAGMVTLSGENPGDATFGPGGWLYVVDSGRFGEDAGSLSVVDVGRGVEREHHAGFGSFPFAIAAGPDGLLYVGSFNYGIAVWDPASEGFVRGPADAIAPAGVPSTSGLAFDPAGRLYSLLPECSGPGRLLRLNASFAVDAEIEVGACPTAVAFTTLDGS